MDSLAENNLNCGFYQDYLKIHSIYKDLNLNHVDIRLQSQMDTTACIFLFSRQIPRSIVRFMPFADMVTGENKVAGKLPKIL